MFQALLIAAALLVPPGYDNWRPPKDSQFDPAYAGKVRYEGEKIILSPCDQCVLPKTYIDVDVTESGVAIKIDAAPFEVAPGEKFVAAGDIVIRFVNPTEK